MLPPSNSDRPVPVVPGYSLRWAGRVLIVRPDCWSSSDDSDQATSILATVRALQPRGVIVDLEGIPAPSGDWIGCLKRLARETGPGDSPRCAVVGPKRLLEALRSSPARNLVDVLPSEAEALKRLAESSPAEQPEAATVRFSAEAIEATRIGGPSTALAEEIGQGFSTIPSPPQPSGSRLTQLPNYEILSEIARGGMGVVYKARQRGVNRLVALKMTLAGQFAGDDERRRFIAEAEAAGQLDHPHIVPVYEVGEHAGQPYFSMGFVEGTTLRALLSEGPLPPQRAAQLIRKIAEAVHYAHGRGIVHRDLKPANVLIDAQGEPRVTDFGLAKLSTGDSHLTSTGQILGTPSFMPPEQAQGRIADIGPLSDVYSLGATLYALLTGRAPFQSASALETIVQVVQQEPVPPRRLTAGVPAALETICLKCLQKDPARRYASAGDLADDLGRFLRDEPIRARPVGAISRGLLWCRRNPVVAALSGTAVLLLVLAATISTIAYFREAKLAAEKTRLANEKSQLAENESTARKSAETANRLAAQRLLRLQIGTGTRALDDGDAGAALLWYQAARENEPDPEEDRMHRFRLAHALASVQLDLAGIGFHDQGVSEASFHPDGKRVLTTCSGDVRLWDLAESRELGKVMSHPKGVSHARFSPQGEFIATSCADGSVRLWDAASNTVKRSWTLKGGPTRGIAFHPEGRLLVACDNSGRLHVFDVVSGDERPSPVTSSQKLVLPVFHPAGHQLAVMNVNGGTEVWSWPGGKQNGYRALAHPPPATASNQRYTPTYATQSGRLLLREMNERGTGSWSLVSEDGRRLAMQALPYFKTVQHFFAINSEGTRLIVSAAETSRVYDETGRELFALKHPREAHRGVFSPDGRFIATSSTGGVLHLWDATTGTSLRVSTRHSQSITSLAFDPFGSKLLSSSADGTARLWRLNLTPYAPRPLASSASEPRPQDWRFSRDGGRRVRIESDGYGIAVIDTGTNTPVLGPLVRPHPGKQVFGGRADHEKIGRNCLNAAGTRLAFSVPTTGTLAVWDVDRKACVWARSGLYFGVVHALGFSSDDGLLLQSSSDTRARIWDAHTGDPRGPAFAVNLVTHCSFAADNRRVFALSFAGPGTPGIEVFDSRTGDRLNRFPPVPGFVRPRDGTGLPVAWSTGEGLGLGFWKGSVLTNVPDRSEVVPALEFPIYDMGISKADSASLARLVTGRYIDSTEGIQLLSPLEFLQNARPYRDAWLAWRKGLKE